MNKEDYVSHEVAKMLKEKGFNEPCSGWYGINGAIFNDTWRENHNNTFPKDSRLSRPTLYEAAKWLRNEHGIYVTIISSPITWLYKENDGAYITHFPVITYRDAEGKIKMSYHQGMNDSEYDKAFNCAILEALKLI
jgi:hypothetical protein